MEGQPGASDPGLSVQAAREERRNGRLYLVGLAVSVIGDNAMSLAAGIWVKSLTGSSTEAGLVSVCVYAPSLAGPLAGLVADRVRRRRLLIGLNLASAVLILPMLAVIGPDQVWIIYAAMVWYGIHLVLSGPAENALFAIMLSTNMRQRLNGWRLGLQETGRLIAPIAGASLFALIGGGAVAAVDSATFLVAAATLARIRFNESKPQPAHRHLGRELLAGFHHIGQTPQLRRVLVAASVVMGLAAVLGAAQYSLVQGLGQPPSFLGVFSAALGAGSIAASLTSGKILPRLGESRLLILGMTNFAVGNALRATGVLYLAIAASVILGFALPWIFLALLNLAQRVTPPDLQGRVSAAVTLVFFGPQAPLQAIGAVAIRYLTYPQVYLIGTGIAMAAIAGYLYTNRRQASSPTTPGT